MWVSSWITSWVFLAMRALNSVGSAIASSSALVCRLWVPPKTAAIASMVVRTTLLYGSCAVSVQPEVWQWVRRIELFACFGLNSSMILNQSPRAARILAISR